MPRKTIPIYADGDLERLRELRLELAVAEQRAGRTPKANARGGDDDAAEVAEKRDALEAFIDKAAERAESWVVESIGHEEFESLIEAHPAREVDGKGEDEGQKVVHPDDKNLGVNTKTFGKALLLFVDPEDPEHRTVTAISDGELTELPKRLRRLSAGQFFEAWYTAYRLNEGGFEDPKAAIR